MKNTNENTPETKCECGHTLGVHIGKCLVSGCHCDVFIKKENK